MTVIKTRRVHYFSGYDPRGAAHYLRMFKDEALKAAPEGGAVQVGRRRKLVQGANAWDVHWRDGADTPEVATEHVFMSWDDIIRNHWSKGPWLLVQVFARSYRAILNDIRLPRIKAIFHPVFLTTILPAVFLLGSLLLGLLVGGLGQWAVNTWVASPLGVLLASVAVWLLAGAGVFAVWTYGQRKGVFWLLRIFDFLIKMGQGPIQGLAPRAEAWVEQVVRMQEEHPVDEVVLVGHSVGTLVMVDVVDALLRDERWQKTQAGRRTNMLTLGHCYPFVVMMPSAAPWREKLQRLSVDQRLLWWDVTTRIDPLCFFNAHPLEKTDVPHRGVPNPIKHSAQFFKMYEPAHWQQIRQDHMTPHFLYLMAPDKPGNFHFYNVIYGPRDFAGWVQTEGKHADSTQT